MTADHTPERLSAEEQLAPLTWLDWRILRQAALKWAEQVQHGEPGSEPLLGEVKHILAAHLADVEARLAGVEALHKPVQWRGWRLWASRVGRDPRAFVDRWCRECSVSWPCPTYHALHPDPSDPHPPQERTVTT